MAATSVAEDQTTGVVDLDVLAPSSVGVAQTKDDYCTRIRERLRSPEEGKPAPPFFVAENGLLMHVDDPEEPLKGKVVVPKALVRPLLMIYHQLPLAGHTDRDKTLDHIRRRWWWKGMHADVGRAVNACLRCRRRKWPRPLRAGLTTPTGAQQPFEQVHIDIVSGFAETPEGCTKILTMVCAFTRWVIAVPVPNESVETVANALFRYLITVHGCPRRIVSDRAKGFTGKILKHLASRMGIRKIETVGAMPQANGIVERFHRFLNAALCIYARDKENWETHLQAIVFAYRCSVNKTTGVSPFFAVYGRHPALPMDLLFEEPGNEYRDEKMHALTISKTLREVFVRMRAEQQKMEQLNKDRRDRVDRRYVTHFEPGAWVLRWEREPIPRKGKKPVTVRQAMMYRWSTPCRVLSKRDATHYWIHNPVKRAGKQRICEHVSKLRQYFPWDDNDVDWLRMVDEDLAVEESGVPEPRDTVKVGQLVVIPLEASPNLPFCVAKVLRRLARGRLEVQWYGNSHDNVRGAWRPGWIDPKDNRPFYDAQSKSRKNLEKERFTNLTPGYVTDITEQNIEQWGVRLTTADRLPMAALRELSDSKCVAWTLPDSDR